jgi:transposase
VRSRQQEIAPETESGQVLLRRKLARGKVLQFFAGLTPCVIGLEACGGAHFWARELAKLGHDARLMPARYVRAYVKTNKHDAADAEACCEAVQRPGMRFVPVIAGRSLPTRSGPPTRDRFAWCCHVRPAPTD